MAPAPAPAPAPPPAAAPPPASPPPAAGAGVLEGSVVELDCARVAAVLEAHPQGLLLLDANEGYTEAEAELLITKLREAALASGSMPQFLEQPVARSDPAAMQRLTRRESLAAAGPLPCSCQHLSLASAAGQAGAPLAKAGATGSRGSLPLEQPSTDRACTCQAPVPAPAGTAAASALGRGQPRGAGELRIVADESCRSAQEAQEIVREGLAHVVNVKLAKLGVLGALDAIATVQASGDAGLMIGGMVETRLGMGFAAHVAAGLGCFSVTDLDTPMLLASDPVAGGYTMCGPDIVLSNAAGLGCSIPAWEPGTASSP